MNKRILFLIVAIVFVLAFASSALCQSFPRRDSGQRGCAQEVVLSDNWNTDACAMTRRATFYLNEEMYVTRIVAWSNGFRDGGRLPAVLRGPRKEMDLMSTEGSGQASWGERIYPIGRDFSSGEYFLKFQVDSVCQNPQSSGNGFVKVYGCRDYY